MTDDVGSNELTQAHRQSGIMLVLILSLLALVIFAQLNIYIGSSAFIVVLLPLLILGLPTERIEAPDDVLIPAAGWVGTIGAASIGYTVWALPVAITASLAGAMLWTWIQIALILWMLWQGVSMIIWERIPEIDWISKQVYSRLPEAYRAWRTEQMFVWDTRMGIWLAWLSWIAMPTLLAQCVGSRIAGGGWDSSQAHLC